MIQKKFNFNTLGDKLNYLFKTKGHYKDLIRVSLIKAGLKYLKNEIKQMSRMEIFKNKPDEIVNLVEKILDANNLSICYTWKNIKSEYKNNKFKISAPTWNDAFDSPDGSYFVSNIQDYFEYIIKEHETITDHLPVLIYMNKIKNRIIFKIKSGYKLELLSKETMELLGS